MRLRRTSRPYEALYNRVESALDEVCETQANGKHDSSAESVYRETLGVLRRMRAILEGVGDGVFVTDEKGNVRLWNGAAERVTGAPEKKAVGRNCSHVLGLCVRERPLSPRTVPLDCSRGCALLASMEGKTPGSSIEVQRERPGTSDQQLLVSVSVVKGCAGEVTEVVHSVRDITRLKEADEAKTMFLATASHELKTPLTVILGYTQTLRAGWLDKGEQATALESIETRAQQLSRIVDRLLLTGRIEAGRVRLELAAIPLPAMLRERAESLAGATGRTFVCDIPDDLPPVIADADAITTVVDHLLDNAVKYSPDGGDVVLSARDVGSTVLVEVEDSGIGMTPDEVSQCFDRFWQAEQTDVRRYGGTGVGLYIVKSMVEGMGGSVSVAATIGSGSRFGFRLRKAGDTDLPAVDQPGTGPRSMIQEFMRQLGVAEPNGGGS